eukprot:gene2440-2673_t
MSSMPRDPLAQQSLLTDRTFRLTEIVNNEIIHSLVQLTWTGDIRFLSSEGEVVEGSWSSDSKYALRMAIHRTFKGRLSEYTVRSHYRARHLQAKSLTPHHNNRQHENNLRHELQLTGEVVDQLLDNGGAPDRGSFVMHSIDMEEHQHAAAD